MENSCQKTDPEIVDPVSSHNKVVEKMQGRYGFSNTGGKLRGVASVKSGHGKARRAVAS